jgi:hypothetical protein
MVGGREAEDLLGRKNFQERDEKKFKKFLKKIKFLQIQKKSFTKLYLNNNMSNISWSLVNFPIKCESLFKWKCFFSYDFAR